MNRKWLVFANEKLCNHVLCLSELGYISWARKNIKFEIGDIVYIYVSTDKRVRFKTKVVNVDVPREDSQYWLKEAPKDNTHKLQLIGEYQGNLLDEVELMKHGFKGGRSLQQPCCNNIQLISYIDRVFDLGED